MHSGETRIRRNNKFGSGRQKKIGQYSNWMLLQVCTVHDSDVLWSEQNSRKSHTGWMSAVVTEYHNTESTVTGGMYHVYLSTHSSHLSTLSLGKICSFGLHIVTFKLKTLNGFSYLHSIMRFFPHFPNHLLGMNQKFKRSWNFTCIRGVQTGLVCLFSWSGSR